jgi:hypothetical protein
MAPAGLFCSPQAATLLEFPVPLTNCFVHGWFFVVLGQKPSLRHQDWLRFGKFQDGTLSSPLSSPCFVVTATSKLAMAPVTQENYERFSTCWCASFCCLSWLLRCRVWKSQRDLWITLYKGSQDRAVSIAMGHRLNCQRVEVQIPVEGNILLFCTSSRLVVGPTQPPIQRELVDLSPGVRRPGCEADPHLQLMLRSRILRLTRELPDMPSWQSA